jgi:hypothetical protein
MRMDQDIINHNSMEILEVDEQSRVPPLLQPNLDEGPFYCDLSQTEEGSVRSVLKDHTTVTWNEDIEMVEM